MIDSFESDLLMAKCSKWNLQVRLQHGLSALLKAKENKDDQGVEIAYHVLNDLHMKVFELESEFVYAQRALKWKLCEGIAPEYCTVKNINQVYTDVLGSFVIPRKKPDFNEDKWRAIVESGHVD